MKDKRKLAGFVIVAILCGLIFIACGRSGSEGDPYNQPDSLRIGPIRDIGIARIEGEPRCLAVYSNDDDKSSSYTYRGQACSAQDLFDLMLLKWPKN